jgi:hypothetical protein
MNTFEQFLACLKLYERNRLRPLARQVNRRLYFGYEFVYRNQDGADLMYRGQRLGHVRWLNGSIAFDPPLSSQAELSLSEDVLYAWVSRAEYRKTTGI